MDIMGFIEGLLWGKGESLLQSFNAIRKYLLRLIGATLSYTISIICIASLNTWLSFHAKGTTCATKLSQRKLHRHNRKCSVGILRETISMVAISNSIYFCSNKILATDSIASVCLINFDWNSFTVDEFIIIKLPIPIATTWCNSRSTFWAMLVFLLCADFVMKIMFFPRGAVSPRI